MAEPRVAEGEGETPTVTANGREALKEALTGILEEIPGFRAWAAGGVSQTPGEGTLTQPEQTAGTVIVSLLS